MPTTKRADDQGGPSIAPSSRRPDPAPGSENEAALDTLGAILRAFGQSAFDVAELDAAGVRKLFERWSQHVLVAAPLDPEADGEEPARRDWRGLRQLVTAHRKREAAFVETSMANLRNAIWSIVGTVNRAASQDKSDGVLARERLSSLRSALQNKDVEALRREVTVTAGALEKALAEQQKRQEQRLAEFASHVRALGEELETAKREGTIDPLTRLPNRACFDDFLGRMASLTALVGRSISLMMVDVDRFKSINDALGHQAGDVAIRAIADCLVRRFPRRGDLVARYGGDEFAVVLRDTDRKDALMLAQRLVESARETKIVHQGKSIPVSVSVGVAFLDGDDTPESALSRADAALYQAKSAGRNRWAESLRPAAPAGKPSLEPPARKPSLEPPAQKQK